MLKDETLNKLAGAAGLKAEELKAAIESTEEQELTIADAHRFTDDQLQQRTLNELKGVVSRYSTKELGGTPITGDTPDDIMLNLGKQVYNDGKMAALEMAIKGWKEKNGADFQGKDLDAFASYLKSQKADTGELEKTIEQLRQNLTAKDQEFTGLKNDYESKLSKVEIDAYLDTVIPDTLVETIKKQQVKTLLKSVYVWELQDGKIIAKQNGEIVKDKQLLNPLSGEQIATQFVTDNGWLATARPGRGGKDEKGKVTGLEHIHDKTTFFAYCKEHNIGNTSKGALEIVKKLPKEVQDDIFSQE